MSKADSIKGKLKNIAKKEKKQFDYLLMLYMIERLLYRLSISKYSDAFILKGGLLLYTVLDEKARATKDIDMLAISMDSSLKHLKDIFIEICKVDSDDAIIFDLDSITAERIKEDADYEGVRIKVLTYLDKSKKILQFDIGFGDVVVPYPTDMEYPSLLDMSKPKLKAYSIESVIAEKFEAMIYLADINSRMKDFYDIYCLASKYKFDGEKLKAAILKTFERRKTNLPYNPIVLSSNFGIDKSKNRQWNAFIKRIKSDLNITFEEIVMSNAEFLAPIYDSIINKKKFSLFWDCEKRRWDYRYEKDSL